MEYFERLQYYVNEIRKVTDFIPDVAIVLGSGLNYYGDKINKVASINYSDLADFPTCSAIGHVGRFIFGYIGDVKVVLMQGRLHYYEGYQPSEIVLPLRVMKLLGAKTVLFTNAAGSMREDFAPGEFMAINDSLAFLVPSPLRGKNIDQLGERFPDTTDMYDKELISLLLEVGQKNNIKVHQGVYIQAPGPQYEGCGEMRAYKSWGADAVGMSTAMEAIAALHMGMKIVGISCLTNYESGLNLAQKPLTHQEVLEQTQKASIDFEKLVTHFIIEARERELI